MLNRKEKKIGNVLYSDFTLRKQLTANFIFPFWACCKYYWSKYTNNSNFCVRSVLRLSLVKLSVPWQSPRNQLLKPLGSVWTSSLPIQWFIAGWYLSSCSWKTKFYNLFRFWTEKILCMFWILMHTVNKINELHIYCRTQGVDYLFFLLKANMKTNNNWHEKRKS